MKNNLFRKISSVVIIATFSLVFLTSNTYAFGEIQYGTLGGDSSGSLGSGYSTNSQSTSPYNIQYGTLGGDSAATTSESSQSDPYNIQYGTLGGSSSSSTNSNSSNTSQSSPYNIQYGTLEGTSNNSSDQQSAPYNIQYGTLGGTSSDDYSYGDFSSDNSSSFGMNTNNQLFEKSNFFDFSNFNKDMYSTVSGDPYYNDYGNYAFLEPTNSASSSYSNIKSTATTPNLSKVSTADAVNLNQNVNTLLAQNKSNSNIVYVTPNHWAYTAVSFVTSEGLMDATKGQFEANKYVTRAELAKVANRVKAKFGALNGVKASTLNLPVLADVSSKDSSYTELMKAIRDGLLYVKDKTYLPNSNQVMAYAWAEPSQKTFRVQALQTLINASSLDPKDITNIKNYSDVSTSDWFYNYVQVSERWGIATGYKNGNTIFFQPLREITRAELAQMVYNLMTSQKHRFLEKQAEIEYAKWTKKVKGER